MFKDFVLRKQELSFRNSCFIFAAVTISVYRYDRMTVSIRIGCPPYRYCIDTDCIVPALQNKLQLNKRAQRALGRSPEEKVKGHSGANNREPQGHNLNKGRGPFHDVTCIY